MKLFELTADLRQLIDQIEANDGELTVEQEQSLDDLSSGIDSKIESCCFILRERQANIAARTAEIDRLQAGNATDKRTIDSLKAYMIRCLNGAGLKSAGTPIAKARIQANPPSCSFIGEDPATLPPEFQRVKVEANTAAAKSVWKETGSAPDGFSVTVGEHLRVS